MASIPNVCKCSLQYCTMKGFDVSYVTHCIRIYESMCKPYRTAEVVLLNGDGQANELELDVGDEVDFMVMDSEGKTYRMTSYVSAIPEMINADKLREDMVTVATVTTEFMKDRAQMVQESPMGMPVTAAAAAAHAKYIGSPLIVGSASSNMISDPKVGGQLASNIKPFTYIRNTLGLATGGQFSTGSWAYFANKIASNMIQVEQAMTSNPIATDLQQRDTWGLNAQDVFAYRSRSAVLASKLYHKETPPESGGAGAAVKAGSAQQMVFDRQTRFPIVNEMMATTLNGKFGQWFGKYGGRDIRMMTDSLKWPNATAPYTKQKTEAAFQAKVRDSTNYLVKTTIESGFLPQFTAGNRVTAELMATLTDPQKTIKPTLLIADCMHEAYFDNRIVNGTTTIRGVVVSN